jgi:hypothetical protein
VERRPPFDKLRTFNDEAVSEVERQVNIFLGTKTLPSTRNESTALHSPFTSLLL